MGTDATPENKCGQCGIGDADGCGWCASNASVPAAHNGIEGELLSEGVPPTQSVMQELLDAADAFIARPCSETVDALDKAVQAGKQTYRGGDQ